MNLPSILLWGAVATIVLTLIMEGSRRLGWSRMSLPFMFGTMFTPDYDRATPLGFGAFFISGVIIALFYRLVFQALGFATWWLGMCLGLLHGLVFLVVLMPSLPAIHPRMATERSGPEPTRALEPPGFLALNYGSRTPLFTIIAHLAYGAILGGFYHVVGG